MKQDNFINIDRSVRNLDRYTVRSSLLRAVRESLEKLHGKMLDAGCGKMPYKEFILSNSAVTHYIGLDIENALVYDQEVKPDFTWDGVKMPFDDESFDCVFATEVLEHCPDTELFLSEVARVLKTGGVFFFTVPFLWNLHEVPHDEYRFTPFSLERHLVNVGFVNAEIRPLGGWHASMAQMLGLWVRRAPMNRFTRRLLSYVVRPLVMRLYKKDLLTSTSFREGTMITGLYGFAQKITHQ